MTTQAQMEELFASVEGTSVRKMFGGLGIFRRGIMFGLVAEDVLYLKADEGTRLAYEAEGCGQWVYDGKQRPVPMPYWRLPERLYDEPDEFREWALAAFVVAERTAKPKKGAVAKKISAKEAVAKKSATKKPAAKPTRKGSEKPKKT